MRAVRSPTNAATPSSPATSATSPAARWRSWSPSRARSPASWPRASTPTAKSSTTTIAAHAKGWAVDRIAPLDLNVMRVALYEIEHSDDVPDEVAIDEAVEIAKEYCGADAPGSSTASSARSCASGSAAK